MNEQDSACRLLRATRDERTLDELRHTPRELREREADRAKELWEVKPEPPLPCDAGTRLLEAIRGAEPDLPADAGERLTANGAENERSVNQAFVAPTLSNSHLDKARPAAHNPGTSLGPKEPDDVP